MTTTTTDEFANVPHPAGATSVYECYSPSAPIGAGPSARLDSHRYFRGGSWVVARDNRDTDMCLQVDGIQHTDGRVERIIAVDGDDLTVEQARQLAAALIAAADEVEKMAGYDQDHVVVVS